MRQIVITADDGGICEETNAAMEVAFREGVLTGISVMANMPAFADAVSMAGRNPGLGTGIHLVLTSGRPVLPAGHVPLLVDGEGMFRHGFVGLWRLLSGGNRAAAQDQIRRELAAQIEKALDAGLEPTHVDSHQHVHMIPAIWPVVVRLASSYRCRFLRVSQERAGGRLQKPWPSPKNVRKALLLRACARVNGRSATYSPRADHFAGVLDSGCMTLPAFARILRHLPEGLCEIVTHPSLATASRPESSALVCSPEDVWFLRGSGRGEELATLLDPCLRRLLADSRIKTMSFRELAGTALSDRAARTAC